VSVPVDLQAGEAMSSGSLQRQQASPREALPAQLPSRRDRATEVAGASPRPFSSRFCDTCPR
jgi:hypothetical protein